MSRTRLPGHIPRLITALLTSVAVVFGLTACMNDTSKVPDDYITFFGGEPQNPLIPTNTQEINGGQVIENVFTGLARYTPDGEARNAVAESITPNGNSTSFRIKLRDWSFTNGEKITSDSFIDAWNWAVDPANAQLQSAFFAPIQGYTEVAGETDADGNVITEPTADTMSGLKKISDTEFTVTLSAPDSTFPLLLGYSAFVPLPSVFYDDPKGFGEHPIGNGPYMMDGQDAWQHNIAISLKKNPDYPGEDAPKNPGIAFLMYSSLNTAYADLQSGDLDHMREAVSPEAYPTYTEDFPDSHDDKPYAAIQNFTIPENLPGFATDEEGRLRRAAISMSIDRQLIIDKVYFGARQIAEDFGAPTLAGGLPDIKGKEVLTYQPEKAKELWEEADKINPWGGQKFQIAYNSDGGHQQWVEAVTNSIRQNLGINATGKAYPTFKAMRDDVVNGTVGAAFRSGWNADYPSIASFLVSNYRTGDSANDGDYSNKDFDKLLAEAAAQSSPEEAQPIYNDAQEILMKDLPQIPLWYYSASTAWNPDLENVQSGWLGMPVYTEITKDVN
ncbi:peptide ABC transporter substrate-binding protein [Corynebacterium variabile]|uniref:peptide ABC transporter substrate-binding protein n=1 Tax=Corynebacterium variabile TaxID=1727 RepID=UPI001DC28033|nr:ABC transporter substrate-binding protein [Corynebacterium variabile]HJG46560.1 ABC transporter substrate-binding protein [Corynebacterium variabile]